MSSFEVNNSITLDPCTKISTFEKLGNYILNFEQCDIKETICRIVAIVLLGPPLIIPLGLTCTAIDITQDCLIPSLKKAKLHAMLQYYKALPSRWGWGKVSVRYAIQFIQDLEKHNIPSQTMVKKTYNTYRFLQRWQALPDEDQIGLLKLFNTHDECPLTTTISPKRPQVISELSPTQIQKMYQRIRFSKTFWMELEADTQKAYFTLFLNHQDNENILLTLNILPTRPKAIETLDRTYLQTIHEFIMQDPKKMKEVKLHLQAHYAKAFLQANLPFPQQKKPQASALTTFFSSQLSYLSNYMPTALFHLFPHEEPNFCFPFPNQQTFETLLANPETWNQIKTDEKLNYLYGFYIYNHPIPEGFIQEIDEPLKNYIAHSPNCFARLPKEVQEKLLHNLLITENKVCLDFISESPEYALANLRLGRLLVQKNFTLLEKNETSLRESPAIGIGKDKNHISHVLKVITKHKMINVGENTGLFIPAIGKEYLSQKEVEALGDLMAKIYLSRTLLTGLLFDPRLFKAITELPLSELQKATFSETSLQTHVKTFSKVAQINDALPRYQPLIASISNYESQSQSIQEKFRKEIGSYLQIDPEEPFKKYIDENGNVSEAFMTLIKTGDETFKKKVLTAIFSPKDQQIAKGIFHLGKGLVLGLGKAKWEHILKQPNPSIYLSQKTQGSLDRNLIAEYTYSAENETQKQTTWIKQWILHEASEEELKCFLIWLTAAASMDLEGDPITITKGPNLTVGSCFNTLYLPDDIRKIKDKEGFIRELKKEMRMGQILMNDE